MSETDVSPLQEHTADYHKEPEEGLHSVGNREKLSLMPLKEK